MPNPRHATAEPVYAESLRAETKPRKKPEKTAKAGTTCLARTAPKSRHTAAKPAYAESERAEAKARKTAVKAPRAQTAPKLRHGTAKPLRTEPVYAGAKPVRATTKTARPGEKTARTPAKSRKSAGKAVVGTRMPVRPASKPSRASGRDARRVKDVQRRESRAKRLSAFKAAIAAWSTAAVKYLKRVQKRLRRWKHGMTRRHPSIGFYARILWGFLFLLAILAMIYAVFGEKGESNPVQNPGQVIALTTPEPEAAPAATATPVPTVTPVPTPTPEPVYIDGIPEEYFYQTARAGASYSKNSKNGLITSTKVYVGSKRSKDYQREDEIHMVPSVQYTDLEGITTFRGSNYREGSAYGVIPDNPTKLSIEWSQRIGELDGWSGVGWTGQASAVRWPEALRRQMNISDAKKDKDGLVECIYATLDGNIYFFDMEDGKATRKSIDIGAPIKGSVTIDPRGYPLLYCGQGIYDVDGERKKCGTRIWSLYDQSLLHTIYGNDDFAVRGWRAFDCSPLVDAATDTLIQAGENGVLYTLKLNTKLTDRKISIDPETVRYVYNHSLDGQVGTENSIVCYNNYVYFANNSGVIQCVDMNTMKLVWSVDAKDDIDATMAIEVEKDGLVALYATNEVDNRGKHGTSQMFKINALTGELIWYVDSDRIYQHNDNGGGSFASPAIGKNDLSDLVYFHVCRTVDSGAVLYALDKQSGDIVWKKSMGKYGWCSPVCVYTESGRGYVLVGSSNGKLRLFDGLSGKLVASADLSTNIEGTPVVFDDMVVVGTRGQKIYGLKIS